MSEDPQNPERPEGDIFELLASLFGGDRESMERALSQSGINPAELQAMSEQMPAIPPGLEHMFSTLAGGSTSQGPVSWELAHYIARQTAVANGDPSVGPGVASELQGGLDVAHVGLLAATDISGGRG